MGYIDAEGMALSWTEIKNWVWLTSYEFSNWDLSTLKKMTHAYAHEYSVAKDTQRSMPYQAQDQIDRTAVLVKARSVFADLKRNQEK